MVLGSSIEQSSAQVLEGKSREYSKQKDIMVPNEILINKKLNNPAIFQKWEEFFFESGLWSYFRWFNYSSTKYVFLFDQQIILSAIRLLILAHKDLVLTHVFLTGVWFMVFEAAQGVCTLSDYIAEHGALSETQAR